MKLKSQNVFITSSMKIKLQSSANALVCKLTVVVVQVDSIKFPSQKKHVPLKENRLNEE